jgi:hypothetical protein
MEISNGESHKRKEHPMFSDKTKLLNEESSENSSENSTLQKMTLKTKKIKWRDNKFYGEFKKIRSPSFDGEFEERAEAWLLNMGKYFQIYNYPRNMRARLDVHQLNSKSSI